MGSVQFESVAEDLSLSIELIINSKDDVITLLPFDTSKNAIPCVYDGGACASQACEDQRATLWSGSSFSPLM